MIKIIQKIEQINHKTNQRKQPMNLKAKQSYLLFSCLPEN